MHLYCVRHGQSAFNAEGRIQGQLDTPLSDLGHLQSRAVAAALIGCGIQAVIASPLNRALSTAAHLGRALGLPVQVDPRLMEINAGVFQGLTWSEIVARFPQEAERWRIHDPDFVIPNGESRRSLMLRGAAALEAIRDAGYQRAVVVAHGGLLSAAMKSLLSIPADRNPFNLFNCSISQVAWQGQFRLLTLNQTSHLPPLEPGQTASFGDL